MIGSGTIRWLAALLCFIPRTVFALETHVIEDVVGRKIEAPVEIDRILLGESRHLATIAIFDDDNPVKRIVGMFGEFERLDPASYNQYLDAFPQIGDVPRVGCTNENTFSVEQAIALAPQVAIFGLEGHGPTPGSTEVLERLDNAGIKVIFIDFRKKPLVNTIPSIAVLGDLLGKPDVARQFNALYGEQLALVTDRLKDIKARPSVFLESRVGRSEECCETLAHGLFADYLEAAGGRNTAADIVPGVTGMLSMEYLLQIQPDIYIGTAIGSTNKPDPKRVVLGVGASAQEARNSLLHVLERQDFPV